MAAPQGAGCDLDHHLANQYLKYFLNGRISCYRKIKTVCNALQNNPATKHSLEGLMSSTKRLKTLFLGQPFWFCNCKREAPLSQSSQL